MVILKVHIAQSKLKPILDIDNLINTLSNYHQGYHHTNYEFEAFPFRATYIKQ